MKIVFQKTKKSEDAYTKIFVVKNNEIAGSCQIDGYHSDEHLVIYSLYIMAKYRRKGVASQILTKALEIAKQSKKKCIYLTVKKVNKNAIKCYKKNGFKIFLTDTNNYWMGISL